MRLIASLSFCSLLFSSTAFAQFAPTYTYDPYVASANNYYEEVGTATEEVSPVPMSDAARQQSQPMSDQPAPTNPTPNNGLYSSMPSVHSYGCADGSCDTGNCDGAGYGMAGYLQNLSCLTTGWYGNVGGLVMTRDLPDRRILTSEFGNPSARVLSNRDAGVDWRGGFEVFIGRCIDDQLRWEAGYWQVGSFTGRGIVLDPTNSLISTIDLNNVDIGPDQASDFFDLSGGHAVYRDSDFQNIEINMVYRPGCFGSCGDGACGYSDCDYGASCGSPWCVEFLAGLRYFRFDDFFAFAGVEGGANFGDLGGRREAYIQSNVENHLIGAQIGALIDYNVAQGWTLYARPKFGIYGNQMNQRFNVIRGDGLETGFNTITGDTYPARSNRDDVSFLAELDLGVRWEFNNHWSAYAAYRVVAVTGVALSDDQIPAALADVPSVRAIDSNGSLVLHGIVAGLQFQF